MSTTTKREDAEYTYDVALSFAGEQRDYAHRVADELKNSHGVRVFYDEYEKVSLWGKDLYSHLHDVYESAAKYCVIFVSADYARKVWTNHERMSAQERALRECGEYILPVCFDATSLPGLSSTIGYLDASMMSPAELANAIREKLGSSRRLKFLPPFPDRLFARLEIPVSDEATREHVTEQAFSFFRSLTRLDEDERRVVCAAFAYGCPHDLPNNVHIDLDLLKRITGFAPTRIDRLLSGIRSVGISYQLRVGVEPDEENEDELPQVVLEYDCSNVDACGPATSVAYAMIDLVATAHCEECGRDALQRLDFSALASATVKDGHEDGS